MGQWLSNRKEGYALWSEYIRGDHRQLDKALLIRSVVNPLRGFAAVSQVFS